MLYVKINEQLYPASIAGKMQDKDWDGRESKAITLSGTFEEVDALFPDGATWAIVSEAEEAVHDEDGVPVTDENGDPVMETVETVFDNSDFNVRGDITMHTDGTCTVKMGKQTDLEDAYELMFGGE